MDPAAILSRVLDQPTVAKIMRVLDIYGRAAEACWRTAWLAALFAAIRRPCLCSASGLDHRRES
jgi:hypothetical protein